jgi:hypothetical protein
MTNTEQNAVDQDLCRAIVEHRNKRAANRPCSPDRDLAAGDTIQTSAGKATVEQRHLAAVELFLQNHWSADPAGVTFRVQPPTNDTSK